MDVVTGFGKVHLEHFQCVTTFPVRGGSSLDIFTDVVDAQSPLANSTCFKTFTTYVADRQVLDYIQFLIWLQKLLNIYT